MHVLEWQFPFHFQANGLAALGQYKGGMAGAAADKSLFVADHKY